MVVRPVTVERTIGKKQSRNTIIRIGFVPQPKETTSSGPSAIFGTALTATSSGANIRSRCRDAANAIPINTPATAESRKP